MTGTDARFVRELARTFNRKERQVLALHYCESLSPIEIGLVLDMSTIRVEETLLTLRERTRSALAARQQVSETV